MIELQNPVAIATIRWVTASGGGRSSGPPTAPVYATTSVFKQGEDAQVQPGWPQTADPKLSILIERFETLPDGDDLARIGFLFPDLAIPYMHVGAELVILEGPKVVAHALVREML